MATIPSHALWLNATKATGRKRSEHLQNLDAAIQNYERNPSAVSRDAIRTALDRWKFDQSSQGKDWRSSVRNRTGAVTSLYRAIQTDKRALTAEELEAMEYISRAQAMALMKQFDSKKVTFKSSTIVGMARGAGTKWEMFKTSAQSVVQGANTGRKIGSGIQKIHKGASLLQQGGHAAAQGASAAGLKDTIVQMCGTLCPGKNPNEVFAALGLPSVDRFAMDLAPFVGAISSGVGAVVAWIKVIRTQFARSDIGQRRSAFAPEDPEAAFDALLVLLDRELAAQVARAGVKTGAFTGKTLGAFADAGAVTGPVIGLLEILADIMQTIIEYMRDLQEVDAANEMLELGALNLHLFKVSPILGCYFLVMQDHSTIINFAVAEYGTPHFVFDAEQLVRKINPCLERAQQFIQNSRYEIREFAGAKGVVGQHWTMKGPLSHVRKGEVKPVGVQLRDKGEEVATAITDRIAQWRKQPVRTEKLNSRTGALRARVNNQGFGSNGRGGFGTK